MAKAEQAAQEDGWQLAAVAESYLESATSPADAAAASELLTELELPVLKVIYASPVVAAVPPLEGEGPEGSP